MMWWILTVLELIFLVFARVFFATVFGIVIGVFVIGKPITWAFGEDVEQLAYFMSSLLGTACIGYYFGMEDWRPKGKTKPNKRLK